MERAEIIFEIIKWVGGSLFMALGAIFGFYIKYRVDYTSMQKDMDAHKAAIAELKTDHKGLAEKMSEGFDGIRKQISDLAIDIQKHIAHRD